MRLKATRRLNKSHSLVRPTRPYLVCQADHYPRRNFVGDCGLCIFTRTCQSTRRDTERLGYVSLLSPFCINIQKGLVVTYSGQNGGMSGGIMSNASNNSEGQDLSDELGHLYLGPQSKSRYVSPDFFAMISQEVRLLYSFSVGSLLTLHRSQKSIIYSSSNSSTLLIPSSMFCERSKITHCKTDHIVVARRAIMIPDFTARPSQDSSVAIFSHTHRHGP
jgi:hypothetical protein